MLEDHVQPTFGCCGGAPRPREFADALSLDGKYGVTSNKKVRKSSQSDDEEEQEYIEQRQHLE